MRGLIYYLILLPILRIRRLSDSTHLFMYIKHYIRAVFCETVDYNDTREEITAEDSLSSRKQNYGIESSRIMITRGQFARGIMRSLFILSTIVVTV